MRRALAVGRKEFRQIVRDRRTLTILLFIPLFFLLLFGYALNFDIRHIRLAVDDRDQSAQSRELVSAFVNSGYFDLVARIEGPADLDRMMNWNQARAALVIPAGLARELRAGRTVTVQVVVNGDNVNTASTVMAYAASIVQSVSASLQLQQMVPGRAPGPPIVAVPRIWYNPELKSALFLVPGLIAFIGMITSAISTTMSIVKEKERGTWEQVRMAPINTVSYVLGKTTPYLLISLLSVAMVIVVAMVLFGLPVRGSWLLLLGAVLLFLAGALGTGLLISTLADSQLIAFQVVALIAFLPTMLLSGFVFPIASMPTAIQIITGIVPARYFLVALRGVMLKGTGLHEFWPQLVALAVYAVVVLGLASVRLARERG